MIYIHLADSTQILSKTLGHQTQNQVKLKDRESNCNPSSLQFQLPFGSCDTRVDANINDNTNANIITNVNCKEQSQRQSKLCLRGEYATSLKLGNLL